MSKFLTGSAVGCGESDKFKTRFFIKFWCTIAKFFASYVWVVWRILTKFVKTKGTKGFLMLTKFGFAVLIFGDIRPQHMYKNNRFRPAGRHDSRINVTFGTAEGTEDVTRNYIVFDGAVLWTNARPIMHCLRGDGYATCVSSFVCFFVALTVCVSMGYRRAHCELGLYCCHL